eukprot:Seg1476.2_Seg1476.3 transcript_id=Seg1476.2_Seg1476.3/GoldUCD/mRNA.D3Y31 product="hypothetical protein" protein_id=Seg1476.2_Seg1476.3/GoldUCD/D3Y31
MADEEEDLQELRRAVISSIPEKSKDVRVVKSSGKSRSHSDTKDHRHDSHREKERRARHADDNSDLRHQLSRRDRDLESRKLIDQKHHYHHHKVIDQKHRDQHKAVDQRNHDHHKVIDQKHHDHDHHKSSRVASQVQVIRKDDAEKPILITVKNDISNRGENSHKKTRDDSDDEVQSRGERTLASVVQQIEERPRKREGKDSEEGGDSSDMDSDYTFEMRSQKHSDDEDSVYSVEFKNIGGSDDEGSSRGEGSGKREGSDEESGSEDEEGASNGSNDDDAPDIDNDPEFENVRLEDNDDEISGEDGGEGIDGGDVVMQNGGPACEEAEKQAPKRMVTVQHKKKKHSTGDKEKLLEGEERAALTKVDGVKEIADQSTNRKKLVDSPHEKIKEIVVKDAAVTGKGEKTREKEAGKDHSNDRSNEIKKTAESKMVESDRKDQGRELNSKEEGKQRRRTEIKDKDTGNRGTEMNVNQREERDFKGLDKEVSYGKGKINVMKIAFIGKDRKEASSKKEDRREVARSNASKRDADSGREIRSEGGSSKEARSEASKDAKDVGKSRKGVDLEKKERTSSKRLSVEEKTEKAKSTDSIGEGTNKGGGKHGQAKGVEAKAGIEKHVQKDEKVEKSKKENFNSKVHSKPEKEKERAHDVADKAKQKSSKNCDQNQGEKTKNSGPSNARKDAVKNEDWDQEKGKSGAKYYEKNKADSGSKSYAKKKNDLGKSSLKLDDVKSDKKKNLDDKEEIAEKKGKFDAKLGKTTKSSRARSSSVSLGKAESEETKIGEKRKGDSKLRKETKSSRARSSSSSSGGSSSSDSSSSDSDSESSKSSRSGSESSSGSSGSSSSDLSSSSSEEDNFKRKRKRNSEPRNSDIDRRRKSKSPRKDAGRGYVSPLRTDRSEWGKKDREINDRNGRDRDRSRGRNYSGVDGRSRGRSREFSRERIRHRTRSRSNDYSRQRRRDFSKEAERRNWERGDHKGFDNRDNRRDSYNRRDNDRGAFRAERRSLERERERFERPRDRYERPRDREERPRDRVERSKDRDVRSRDRGERPRDRDERQRDRDERPRDKDEWANNRVDKSRDRVEKSRDTGEKLRRRDEGSMDRDEWSRDRDEWANNRVDKPRDRVERSRDRGEKLRSRNEGSRDREERKRDGSKDKTRDEGIGIILERSKDRSEKLRNAPEKPRSRNDSGNQESKERDPERLPSKTEENDERAPRKRSRSECKDTKEDHSTRSDKVEEKLPKPLMEKKIDVNSLKDDKEPDRRRSENGAAESRHEREGVTRNTDRKEINSRNDTRKTKDGTRRERAVNTKLSVKERLTKDVKPRPLMEITLPNVKKLEARVDRRPSRRVSLTQRNRSRNFSDDDLRNRRNPKRLVSIDDELNYRKRSADVDRRDIRDSRENRARSPKRHIIDQSAHVKRLSSGKTVLVDQRRLEPLMKPTDFTFGVVEQQPERLENRKTTRRVVTELGNDLKTAVVEVSLDEKDHPQPKRKIFSRLGKSLVNKPKTIAINLKVQSGGGTPQPEVSKEEEQELDQRIKQIRERNEEIMRRKKEIEDDIKLHS